MATAFDTVLFEFDTESAFSEEAARLWHGATRPDLKFTSTEQTLGLLGVQDQINVAIVEEELPTAVGIIVPDSECAELQCLTVPSHLRGQGRGTRLLDECVDVTREHLDVVGRKMFQLLWVKPPERVTSFFERRGFVPHVPYFSPKETRYKKILSPQADV